MLSISSCSFLYRFVHSSVIRCGIVHEHKKSSVKKRGTFAYLLTRNLVLEDLDLRTETSFRFLKITLVGLIRTSTCGEAVNSDVQMLLQLI
jgi:hypothetical protein